MTSFRCRKGLGFAAFEKSADEALVHKRERMVEAAHHFRHPLMLQDSGTRTSVRTTRAAALERVPDHSCFDRLAESDFIGKHQARKLAFAAGALAKVILVRNQIHARADHAAHRRDLPFTGKHIRALPAQEFHVVGGMPGRERLEYLRKNARRPLGCRSCSRISRRRGRSTRRGRLPCARIQ